MYGVSADSVRLCTCHWIWTTSEGEESSDVHVSSASPAAGSYSAVYLAPPMLHRAYAVVTVELTAHRRRFVFQLCTNEPADLDRKRIIQDGEREGM